MSGGFAHPAPSVHHKAVGIDRGDCSLPMGEVHQNVGREAPISRAPQHHTISHAYFAEADCAPSCDFSFVVHLIDPGALIIPDRERLPMDGGDETYPNAWIRSVGALTQ